MTDYNGKTWSAKWIGRTACMCHWTHQDYPAPYFRRVFLCPKLITNAKLFICGLGYHELYLNGGKVGAQVLAPVVSQYDKRVRYLVHDVTSLLREGANTIGIVLGNGWYNCNYVHVTEFDKASWRDYPKLLLELEIDGKVVLTSDATWKYADSPLLFNSVRNGEHYDARKEVDGWLEPDFDDSVW